VVWPLVDPPAKRRRRPTHAEGDELHEALDVFSESNDVDPVEKLRQLFPVRYAAARRTVPQRARQEIGLIGPWHRRVTQHLEVGPPAEAGDVFGGGQSPSVRRPRP
jgi:hypothetical protein